MSVPLNPQNSRALIAHLLAQRAAQQQGHQLPTPAEDITHTVPPPPYDGPDTDTDDDSSPDSDDEHDEDSSSEDEPTLPARGPPTPSHQPPQHQPNQPQDPTPPPHRPPPAARAHQTTAYPKPAPRPPVKLTLNAAHSIQGSGNLVPTSPSALADATKLSAAVVSSLNAVLRREREERSAAAAGGAGVGAGAGEGGNGGAGFNVTVDLTINCGITVVGNRNVVGCVGVRPKSAGAGAGVGVGAGVGALAAGPAGAAGVAGRAEAAVARETSESGDVAEEAQGGETVVGEGRSEVEIGAKRKVEDDDSLPGDAGEQPDGEVRPAKRVATGEGMVLE